MKNLNSKRIIWSDYVAAICVAVLGVGFFKDSAAVTQGVRDGLKVCANVLVPALFSFMALASFMSLTSAARILSKPLEPITTRILKLPEELGAIVLLSLVGGFPVGAKSISLLLSQKKITKVTAERMLCFCVNSGPSFLITAVGVGMMTDKTAGIILFFSQTFATLLIGAVVSLRVKRPQAASGQIEMSRAEAFVTSVSSASQAMIAMCSFAVFFSGILALIMASGFVDAMARATGADKALIVAITSGIFEVTSGCLNAAKLGGGIGFTLISAIVSFGGLSVLFQIMSCFREELISFKPLILARISHIFISLLIAAPLYEVFCKTQNAFASSGRPIIQGSTGNVFISVCLICMCAIMTLSSRKI